MANLNQVSFTSPYAADESAIAYRRKLAEMLAKEAIEPLQTNRMAGRFVVPVSPWEGAAKLAKGIGSGLAQRESEEKQKELARQMGNDADNWARNAPQARPTSQPGFGGEPEQATGGMTQPTQADKMAYLMQGSRNPVSAPFAGIMAQQMMKDPESAFAKVDPRHYTPESIAKFSQTNKHADLIVKPEFAHVAGVGPTGAPTTTFYNKAKPPEDGIPGPLPGFLGELQALGVITPGQETDPRVQAILRDYMSHKTGGITSKDVADLKIKLANLQNDGIGLGLRRAELNFNTGTTGMGGGAPLPQLFGGQPQMGGSVMAQPQGQRPIMPMGQPQQPPQQQPMGAPVPQMPQGAPAQPQQAPQPVPRPAPQVPRAMAGPQPMDGIPLVKNPTITPKERQELVLKQPKEDLAARISTQKMERLLATVQELRAHQGLDSITGKINQYGAFDMFPEARAARGLQKNIINAVGIQELQAMRDASKTGGAVGQVTEKEWPILQQSIAALDDAQATGDYQKALENLEAQLKTSMQNVKGTYEQNYGQFKYEPTPHVGQGRNEISGKINWDANKEKRYQELLRKQNGAK